MNFSSDQVVPGHLLEVEASCPICTSHQRRLVSRVGRKNEKLDTVICTGCGLIHSHPIPTKEELAAFYSNHYRTEYKGVAKPKFKHVMRYAPGALARVREILSFAKPGQVDLLDIGTGSGEFLFMALKMGLNGQGVEPNKGYAEYCHGDLGLPVRNAFLEEGVLRENGYDIINLNHVLEHLPDPLATLREIHRALRTDGLFAVAVPDISLCSHAPWTQFHRAHIYNFNHETLKAMLELAGFAVKNAERGGTSLVAQKISSPPEMGAPSMEANYARLWERLSQHSGVSHYSSTRPYARLGRKLFRYTREFILTQRFKTARDILEHTFATAAKTTG